MLIPTDNLRACVCMYVGTHARTHARTQTRTHARISTHLRRYVVSVGMRACERWVINEANSNNQVLGLFMNIYLWLQRILRFWLDRGVDGFRVVNVQYMFEDADLRNEPKSGCCPEQVCLWKLLCQFNFFLLLVPKTSHRTDIITYHLCLSWSAAIILYIISRFITFFFSGLLYAFLFSFPDGCLFGQKRHKYDTFLNGYVLAC